MKQNSEQNLSEVGQAGAVTQKRPFTAILLDMDGVLFHGMEPIDGAIAFMEIIADFPHAFITNNPIRLPQAVADKLEHIGFKRPLEKFIVTAGEATASWLAQQKPGFTFFAVGAKGLRQSLSQYGNEDPENADFVVIGEGEGIDYSVITTGINLILKKGAKLISTNPDTTVDAVIQGKRRVLPGGGALVAPFAAATGQTPVTIGKPESLLYEMAMQVLGVKASDCLMIGDRPDTDIIGAQKLGIKTALVRTGRFAPGEALPQCMQKPDWDVNSLSELQRLFG